MDIHLKWGTGQAACGTLTSDRALTVHPQDVTCGRCFTNPYFFDECRREFDRLEAAGGYDMADARVRMDYLARVITFEKVGR